MSVRAKNSRASSIGLLIVTFIVLVLCIFLLFKTHEANRELEAKQEELDGLVDAITEADNKTREMEEEIRYRATDEYIEEAARDIGLIDPNETIISPE